MLKTNRKEGSINDRTFFLLLDSMKELYQNKVINDCEGGYQ